MIIDIQNCVNDEFTPDNTHFIHWINLTTQSANIRNMAMTVRIVDCLEMIELNRNYRSQNKNTNVLSFPFEMPNIPNGVGIVDILGDVVICAKVVNDEALKQNKPPINHWAHITIHGVLHLLGFDHTEDDKAKIMEDLETKLLQKIFND